MSLEPLEQVVQAFRARYGTEPTHVVRGPGRVNLIGEHTDYNGGFVLPMAIDRATWMALRATANRQVRVHSLAHSETLELDLDRLSKATPSWREYPKAVAWALADAGFEVRGFDAVSVCQVPMGAGLSSSASFELALARAFQVVSGYGWDPVRQAVLCQRAENDWIGVSCGVMDPLIAATGIAGHATLIDCRSLLAEALPLPPGTLVVVMDTTTRRDLTESAYNTRRTECERAARHFGLASLCDLEPDVFEARLTELAPEIRRRVSHVLSENRRTLQARDAMLRGDARLLGALIDQSHVSLRDEFEVSTRELDSIVDVARGLPGCFGARMTGAGFGGCAVALVKDDAAQAFVESVAYGYQQATKLQPAIYVCRAAEGASVISLAVSAIGSDLSALDP